LRTLLVLAVITTVLSINSVSAEGNAYPTLESTYKDHTRAVALARDGHYSASLEILRRLLAAYPDNYPLQRDTAMISAWKGDCRQAHRYFRRIRSNPKNKPYLLEVIGECMLAQGRNRDAIALATKWRKRYPDSSELKFMLEKARVAETADRNTSPVFEVQSKSDESDQGFLVLMLRTEFSIQVAPGTRLFGAHYLTRARDASLQSGEQDRIGVGVRHKFSSAYFIEQSFSKDINQDGQGRSATLFQYTPSDTWKFEVSYTNFSLDIPIRAQADNIDAKEQAAKVTFDLDESWYWHLSMERLNFSDSNRRRALYTEISYPVEKKPLRRQRLGLEIYGSSNTLRNAVYFNPSRDRSITLAHQIEFLRKETRFRARTDRILLDFGSYYQQGFGTHSRWGLGFQQEFVLTDASELEYGIRFARNVYDGTRDNQAGFELKFRMRF